MRRALATPLVLLCLLAAPPASAQQRTLTPPPPPPRPPSELPVPPPPPAAPEPAAPAPAPAAAPASPDGAAGPKEAASAEKGSDAAPLLGFMLDGGFPDGLGASLLYRPLWFTRFHGGVTYNFLGPGLRLGATLVPFHFYVTPTLSGEYGHAFDTDASGLVSRLGKVTPAEKLLLKKVGYDYLSLQLGIETGSPRTMAWFFRVGLSWIFADVNNFQAAAQSGSATITSASNPRIRLATPSVATGLYLFVW